MLNDCVTFFFRKKKVTKEKTPKGRLPLGYPRLIFAPPSAALACCGASYKLCTVTGDKTKCVTRPLFSGVMQQD